MTDSAQAGDVLRPETLDFMIDFSKSGLTEQFRQAEDFASRAVQVFAAASVVIGLVATQTKQLHVSSALLSAAVASYLVVGVATSVGVWILRLYVSDDPTRLYNEYWADEVFDVKHAMLDDMARGYALNLKLLRHKQSALVWAVGAASVETLLVGIALLLALT